MALHRNSVPRQFFGFITDRRSHYDVEMHVVWQEGTTSRSIPRGPWEESKGANDQSKSRNEGKVGG